MKKITRLVETRVVESLKVFPAVYIAGPRQAGKTTLAKHIATTHLKARYITFDDIQSRSLAKRDPETLLRALEGPAVLDEVQMVPEIFRPLKLIVDENRNKEDGGRGRFLLTGSASVMALPQLSDAMVGRMALQTLLPFSACEIYKQPNQDFISRAFTGAWEFSQTGSGTRHGMYSDASFPELLSLKSPDLRYEWCNGYLNTILQRDVRALLDVKKITTLPDMLQFFSTKSGGVLNEASLSRATQLNHITTKKYRILLENLFLTLSIPAWSSNPGKRLVKSPKVYLSDLNLLVYLSNASLEDLSVRNPTLWGQVLENFVAIELSKQLTFSKTRAHLHHYRTSAGQEVDFLLEGPQGRIVAIEIKSTSKVSVRDFRHIESLQADIPDRFDKGFVIYQGRDVVPFSHNLFAIPMHALWQS